MKKIFLLFPLFFAAAVLHGQACFKNEPYLHEQQSMVSGDMITKAVLADMNNDAVTDMVGFDVIGNLISFYMQQPGGSFLKTDSLHYNDNYLNVKLKVIDIDNNGTRDVAALLDYGVLFIYTDGAGHIVSLDTLLQGDNAYVFEIGDYNDDGINDVVINTSAPAAKVYAGTVSSGYILKDSIQANFRYIRITDMNNDGKNDIVYGGDCYACAGPEDGGVLSKDPNDSLVQVFSVPSNYHYFMQTADLYTDGMPDIQLSNGFSIMSYKNNGGFSFTLTQQVNYMPHAGFAQYNWFTSDIDTDGDADFVLSVDDKSFIFYNSAGLLDTVNFSVFTTPLNVLGVADMNSDGEDDIVLQRNDTTQATYAFLNKGNGVFEGANFMNYEYGGYGAINSMHIVKTTPIDLDHDGFTEIIASGISGLTVYHNNGNRTWDRATVLWPYSSAYSDCVDFDFGYLNNDSTYDCAMLSSGSSGPVLQIYYGITGALGTTYDSVKIIPQYTNTNMIKLADINGDGWKDLVLTLRPPMSGIAEIHIRLNNGNGSFGPAISPYPSGLPPLFNTETYLRVADYDNDNDQDIFFMSLGAVAFAKCTGGTSFAPPVYVPWPYSSYKYIIANANNDGFLDIITLSYANDTIKTFTGSSAGFTFNSYVIGPPGLRDITAKDIDNDGNVDILALDPYNSSVDIMMGQGTGSFVYGSTVPLHYQANNSSETVISEDFDNNGFADIITTQGPQYVGDHSKVFFFYSDTLELNITSGATICEDKTLSLQTPASSSIDWFQNSVDMGQHNVNPLTVSQTGIYTATVINNYGCAITSDSITIYVSSCDSVWPGDATMNGVCDGSDLLSLGVNYGATGTVRALQDNTWSAHAASDWGVAANGLDLKFSDCNGDGSVDMNDTLAIVQNFASLHTLSPIVDALPLSTPVFYFTTASGSYLPGQYIDVDIWLGSSVNPVNNLYGIAFDIQYDASVVEPATELLSFSNSWFASPWVNAVMLRKPDAAANTFHAAISRTDHLNADGFGKIASFRCQALNSILTSTPLTFSVSGYSANDSSLAPVFFSRISHTISIDPLGTTVPEEENDPGVVIYPNPYSDHAEIAYFINRQSNVSIEVYDAMGQLIETLVKDSQPAGEHHCQFSAKQKGFTGGIYFVKVSIDGKITMKRIIEMK